MSWNSNFSIPKPGLQLVSGPLGSRFFPLPIGFQPRAEMTFSEVDGYGIFITHRGCKGAGDRLTQAHRAGSFFRTRDTPGHCEPV